MSTTDTTVAVDTDKLPSLQWSFLPPMKIQREGSAAVSVGENTVAVVGGYHAQHKFLSSCSAYQDGQWKDWPEMSSARMGCGACSIGRNIIVAGGFTRKRTYLNTVEMMDTTSLSTWKPLPPMRSSRAGCAAVAIPPGEYGGVEGVVIICGGWKNADTAVDTVEQLDLATGEWSLLPSMLTARAGCAAVVVNGDKIVVTGGYSNYSYCLSTAEVFDVTTQAWSSLPSMKERRDASALCAVGNVVMVAGGGATSTRPSRTCEVLNMDNIDDGWRSFPHLKSPRFGCSAAAMQNQIVVLGGRGPGGQHLECVETVTLPILDKPKTPQRQRSKSDLSIRTASSSESNSTNPSSEEWKQMVDSTLRMANHMMAKDRARTNETYERARTHEMDECGRKLKEVEKKLKTLAIEKHRLEREKEKAMRNRDERLLELEEQRQQSLAQIEKNFRPLISKAANSSAPEYFVGDVPSMSPSPSASELALQIRDEPEGPPEELICSITGVLMKDPVTAVDGHTYERAAIETWFKRFKTGKPTSPMTNEKLSSRRLISSHNIRSQCRTWLERRECFDSACDMAAEVQSCVEPRQLHHRRRSSMSSRHLRSSSEAHYQRSSSNSRARRPRRHSMNSSDSALFTRSSSASRTGRSSSASRTGRSTSSRMSLASSRSTRLDTEPPSPLGRSFTLFSRRNSASGVASMRRPSH